MSEVVVKLDYPIDYGSEKILEVKLRRPKGKDIKNISQTPTMEDLLKIASKCSGQSTTVFDEMDMSDIIKVVGVIGDFLQSGQPTGN